MFMDWSFTFEKADRERVYYILRTRINHRSVTLISLNVTAAWYMQIAKLWKLRKVDFLYYLLFFIWFIWRLFFNS